MLNKQEALGAPGEASQQRVPPGRSPRPRILLEGPCGGRQGVGLDLAGDSSRLVARAG